MLYNKNLITNLETLRKNALIFSCYSIIAFSTCLIFLRTINQQYALVVANLITITLCLITIFAMRKRVHELAFMFISIALFTTISYFTYRGQYPLYGGIVFIVLITISSLFFVTNRYLRFFYFILAICTFSILTKHYQISLVEVVIQWIIFYSFFFVLSDFISLLETKLVNENIKKEDLIQDLQAKNNEIQLYNNIMAHDIKAPLSNIKGFNGLVQKKITSDYEMDKIIAGYFKHINSGIASLENLIDNLLLKSKIEFSELHTEKIELESLIDKILDKYRYKIETSKFSTKFNEIGTIRGDKNQVSILFSNLISNSIKYQPQQINHTPKLIISQEVKNERDIIYIQDNGIGINSKHINSIFEPFKRLHTNSEYEGTGLGLNICKKIVEKHKGEISVTSAEGKGTTFRIELPMN